MFILIYIAFVVFCTANVNGNKIVNTLANSNEVETFKVISDIISTNLEDNCWSTILCYGPVPDEFYSQTQHLNLTYLHIDSVFVAQTSRDEYPYLLHTVIISCSNITEYNIAIQMIPKMYSWNPNAKIIVNIKEVNELAVAQIFYTFWWYQSIHVLLVHYVEQSDSVEIYNYNPYSYVGYHLQKTAKCWSTKQWTPDYYVDVTITARCQAGCGDIRNSTNTRRKYLITCMSFNKQIINFNTVEPKFLYIEDQTRDLHGYPLKAFGQQIPPFLLVYFFENGSYVLQRRDGIIWKTMAECLNFTIELVHFESFTEPFLYAMNSKMIFDMSYRKIDLVLYPLYQLDFIVSKVQLLFPIRDSGVCIVTQRADFVANWFDMGDFSYEMLAMFIACLFCVWSTFALFKYFEIGRLSWDQLGKDFCNTIRNVLTVSLYKPPRRRMFRLYMGVSLWSFFLINFVSQASIMSFLTVLKRGKEVDTIQDVVDLGYPVQGFWSPDMVLPDTVPLFNKFMELKVNIEGMYDCVEELEYNHHLCCLLDCTLAKHYAFNKMNKQGKPYMHVLQDKIHSRFLHMALPHQSPLSRRINRYMMGLSEGGIIKKLEGSRYDRIHEEAPEVKPISLSDFDGLFQTLAIAMAFSVFVFLCELVIGNRSRFKINFNKVLKQYNLIKHYYNYLILKRKLNPIEVSTQTEP